MFRKSRPQPPPLVYAVTLTWNQREDTLTCLKSLSQMTYPNFRLLLVDNGSTDGTVPAVRAAALQVEIICNQSNLGFSGGFNVGLRHALAHGAEFVFMVNNDTYVAPDVLNELMDYTTDPQVGILSPKIYSADEPNRIWSLGGKRNWWNYEMLSSADGQPDNGQWEQPMEQDYLIGCAFLLKRSLLETVGLFDEANFNPIYYEDSDLCFRARQAGFRLLLVPSGRMWHKGVGSGGGFDSPRQRYLMAQHSIRFFRKHVRGWRWLIVVPWRLGSAVKTTWRLLRSRRYPSLVAHWRGLRDGLLNRNGPL